MSEMGVQHRAGRWFGGVIFLIGLGMMAAVFALAVIAFLRVPEALMGGGGASGEGVAGPLAAAGVQIGFLFVMAYLSSLFASKGLELFSIARTRAEE